MKKYLALIFMLALASNAFGQATTPLPLQGDRMVSASITDGNCPGDITASGCVVINTQGATGITVNVAGGWACGTTCYLFFEASPSDNGPWVPLNLLDYTAFVPSFAITSNGIWTGNVGGYRKFRVRAQTGIFQAGTTARITLNVGSGSPPKLESIRSYNFHATLLSASNQGGFTYPITQCRDFKNVQISINATGENIMTAAIEVSYSSLGPWVSYKQVPIGSDISAVFNGQIPMPYFRIFVPYDGTTAGDVTIIGGCKQ